MAARPLQAQRLKLPADSLEKLISGLAPEAQKAARTYLEAADAQAEAAFRNFRQDPHAEGLVLAALELDPLESLRYSIASSIRYYLDVWLARPNAMAALADRVARDPSARVVAEAAASLRVLALAKSGLANAVKQRIQSARASGDTAALRVAIEQEEVLTHAEQNIVAPPFVRPAAGPFVAVPAGRSIRFSVFGDYGVSHLASDPRYPSHQAEVAQLLKAYHAKSKLDFGITTGDNFYPTSFASPTDPNWQVSWANLYDQLGIPFYISLGNHDWGEPSGPLAEYVYGQTSKSWKLPAYYYTYTAGPVQFFAINTNALTERQLEWLKSELAKSTAKWKFVYGHFPAYEQTDYTVKPQQERLVPILKQHHVDAYFAGHHHTMQHWAVDGVDYFVAGAGGAGNYDLGDTTKVAPDRKFMRSAPGFAAVEVNESSYTLRFIGRGGVVLYEYTRKK